MADDKGPKGSGTDSAPTTNQISAPTISLPKGGGAIRGMGEKFAANPVTGTGSMSVPIATSPGRGGFGPQLSLSYDSGSGNGPFGLGWNLSLPSITRKTDKGLRTYRDAEESDVFILSSAEDLVPEFEKNAAGNWILKDGKHVTHDKPRTVDDVEYRVRRYRPRIEACLPVLSAGLMHRVYPTGALFPKTTSPRYMAARTKAALLILQMRRAFSVG